MIPASVRSKRSNRLKVLWFDRNGYCILYKCLHRAHFELPDATELHRPLARIDARGSPLCSAASNNVRRDRFQLTEDRASIMRNCRGRRRRNRSTLGCLRGRARRVQADLLDMMERGRGHQRRKSTGRKAIPEHLLPTW